MIVETENNERIGVNNSEQRKQQTKKRRKQVGKQKFCQNVRGFVFCLAALQFVQVMGSG